MPKAKPVSLHPLNFDDAINALLKAVPKKAKAKKKSRNLIKKKHLP